MNKVVKAESLISVLIALSLWLILYFTYIHWQSEQHRTAAEIYQRQQALQIAENQIALKMARLPCEKQVQQNNLTFQITCREQKMVVTFPLGNVEIGQE